jgi:hypothetical protein
VTFSCEIRTKITTENTNVISKSIFNAIHRSRLQDDKLRVHSWYVEHDHNLFSMETLFQFYIHGNISLEMENGHRYTLADMTESLNTYVPSNVSSHMASPTQSCECFHKTIINTGNLEKPSTGTYRSWYSDWLRAGRPSGRSSSPGRVMNFLFSTSSRPALGSTQPFIQWYGGSFPGGKAAGG